MPGTQQLGTMDLVGEHRSVMFCADDDRPAEGLLTWIGDELLPAGGVAVEITVDSYSGSRVLKPTLAYRTNSVGGLYVPPWEELSDLEQEMRLAHIVLRDSPTGTSGQWSQDIGRPENSIVFAPQLPAFAACRKLQQLE